MRSMGRSIAVLCPGAGGNKGVLQLRLVNTVPHAPSGALPLALMSPEHCGSSESRATEAAGQTLLPLVSGARQADGRQPPHAPSIAALTAMLRRRCKKMTRFE